MRPTWKILCLLFGFLLYTSASVGHPSYGLVVTPDGDIFFCDVLHHEGTLWRIDRAGRLDAVLTGVHSHFIMADAEGSVWGTDHDYLPSIDGNRNSLWKLTEDLSKVVVIPPTTDPRQFSGVNFVVDSRGTVFFAHDHQLYVRGDSVAPRLFIPEKFGRITSLQIDRDDMMYVVDTDRGHGSVFMVSPGGEVDLTADSLREARPLNPPFEDPVYHLLYAAHVDPDGVIYLADSGSRRVLRIAPESPVSTVYRSDPPWWPVAYVTQGGSAYVMEAGFVDGVGNQGPRIVRIRDGVSEVLCEITADTRAWPGQ